jgi:anaerobic dimethyl sulfoxide reductase subunit C (anchor subunit)
LFAVLFLFLGGVYWLQTFASRQRPLLQRVWLFVTILAALAFMASMAMAYSARTILSWDTAFVPLGMLAGAACAGPLLAALAFGLAGLDMSRGRLGLALLAVSAVAAALVVLFTLLQGFELASLRTAAAEGSDLAPSLFVALAVFVLCVVAALALAAAGLLPSQAKPFPGRLACACLLSFIGVFALRIGFYAVHMTVGL